MGILNWEQRAAIAWSWLGAAQFQIEQGRAEEPVRAERTQLAREYAELAVRELTFLLGSLGAQVERPQDDVLRHYRRRRAEATERMQRAAEESTKPGSALEEHGTGSAATDGAASG